MAKGDFGGKRIRPDATMAKIFGSTSMKPTEMSKKYFAYLKKHSILKGRYVTADVNLKPLIGSGKQQVFKSISKLWKYIKRKRLFD